MRFQTLAILAVALIVVLALASLATHLFDARENKLGVALGEAFVSNGVTITPLELLEDSRCPIDVDCIWAGQVRVRAAVNTLSRDFIFVLGGEPQAVGNSRVTLRGVTPATKQSTATLFPSAYRFTFEVSTPQ